MNFHKITGIRGWENSINNQYAIGLEIFYDKASGGAHCGDQDSGKQMVEYSLGADEHITHISGGAGLVLNRAVFHTSKGRKLPVGGSLGGGSFALSLPGGYVRDIAFGYGGHLHNIGAYFQFPLLQPNMITEEDNEDDTEPLKKEKQMKEVKSKMSEERKSQSKFNYSINIQICI